MDQLSWVKHVIHNFSVKKTHYALELKEHDHAVHMYILHTYSLVYEPKKQKGVVIFSLTNYTHLDLKIILVF